VEDGTGTVVATPHVNGRCVSDPTEIPDRTRELNDRLQREGITLDVLPGGELAHWMVERLSDRQLATIAQGPPGNEWVLLEAPFSGLDASYTAAADELRERGLAVLVAHPERARTTATSASVLQHELAAGSALQLTAWSFAGMNGEEACAAALRLVHGPRVVHRFRRPQPGSRSVSAARTRRPPRLRLPRSAPLGRGEPARAP
jgi:protein-tyrosine phosphatase